jgi:hypothetical protein
MAHHNQIAGEGREAYLASRMAEAALLYRRAASAALEIGDRIAWFKNMAWAADASFLKGDTQVSLSMLLEARQSEPEDASPREAWMARKLLFYISLSTRPERARLEQLLTDLRSYANTHRSAAGDLLSLEGVLFHFCGDYRTALARFEAAWQAYDVNSGEIKSSSPYVAADCCLELGQLSACKDWIAALDQCLDSVTTRWSAEITLRLALAEGRPFATLLSHLRTYTNRATGLQRADVADKLARLIARIHLLDPHAGDPAADFHPSRAELRRPPSDRQCVHGRYDAHLLHLDYRLASLRHAAGIPAVDDLYYYQPQQAPVRLTPVDPDQFQGRLHRARAAAKSTLRYARHLDTLLECDYRQREVQARSERIEEIARAIDFGLTGG